MAGIPTPAKIEQFAKKHPTATMAILNHLGALYDARSTNLLNKYGDHEDNPMLKPFAKHGTIFPAMQVTPILEDLLAVSGHKKAARALMGGEAASHFGLGTHNFMLERSKKDQQPSNGLFSPSEAQKPIPKRR